MHHVFMHGKHATCGAGIKMPAGHEWPPFSVVVGRCSSRAALLFVALQQPALRGLATRASLKPSATGTVQPSSGRSECRQVVLMAPCAHRRR